MLLLVIEYNYIEFSVSVKSLQFIKVLLMFIIAFVLNSAKLKCNLTIIIIYALSINIDH